MKKIDVSVKTILFLIILKQKLLQDKYPTFIHYFLENKFTFLHWVHLNKNRLKTLYIK